MSEIKLPPHLVNRKGILLCSECKEVIIGTETLSVSRAFVQHCENSSHRPKSLRTRRSRKAREMLGSAKLRATGQSPTLQALR
jgi:hypothetical protein